MSAGSGEKIDALDLIINALKDHEKKLDALSSRLESLFQSISESEVEDVRDRASEKEKEKEEKGPKPQRDKKGSCITFRKWDEFKTRCKNAKIVAFEIESNLFHVYSKIDEDVFEYSEDLPNRNLRVADKGAYFSIEKSSLNNKIEFLQSLIEGKLKLKCGLNISIVSSRTELPEKNFLFELSYSLDRDEAKEFLSSELDIPIERIVEGRIT